MNKETKKPTLELEESECKILVQALDVLVRSEGLQVAGPVLPVAQKIEDYFKSAYPPQGE